jgi:hypothetical protein
MWSISASSLGPYHHYAPANRQKSVLTQPNLRLDHQSPTSSQDALNAVSVNCADSATSAAVEATAAAKVAEGWSYALAFMHEQQSPQPRPPSPPPQRQRGWLSDWVAVAAFMLLAAPVISCALTSEWIFREVKPEA